VLVLAVNHREEILPFRVREQAKETAQIAVSWQKGQPLLEIADVDFCWGGGEEDV
jgi:hypothetical protein